jgi:uncharacterized protein YggE
MKENFFSAIVIGLALVACGYLFSTKTSTISTAPAVKTLETSAEGKIKVIPDTVIISA